MVNRLIAQDKLDGSKVGSQWWITRVSIEKYVEKMVAEVRGRLRELYPIPPMAELEKETESLLPFPCFGRSGGYGFTRHELKRAIDARDREAVETHYYRLMVEGLMDDFESKDMWDGDCPYSLIELAESMAKHIDPLGNIISGS